MNSSRIMSSINNVDNPAAGEQQQLRQRLNAALLVRRRLPPRFPLLIRKHKAELAELRRRHLEENQLLVQWAAGGAFPLLSERTELLLRQQDEENELLAGHADQLSAKRAQSTRDAAIAICGDDPGPIILRGPIRRFRPKVASRPKTSKRPFSSRDEEDNKEDVTCAICLDDVYDPESNNNKGGVSVTTLNCKHKYHENCIKKWLQRKNLCPLCKRRAIILS